ncbi:unnamed protein product, partial [Durusdinium trenchii]
GDAGGARRAGVPAGRAGNGAGQGRVPGGPARGDGGRAAASASGGIRGAVGAGGAGAGRCEGGGGPCRSTACCQGVEHARQDGGAAGARAQQRLQAAGGGRQGEAHGGEVGWVPRAPRQARASGTRRKTSHQRKTREHGRAASAGARVCAPSQRRIAGVDCEGDRVAEAACTGRPGTYGEKSCDAWRSAQRARFFPRRDGRDCHRGTAQDLGDCRREARTPVGRCGQQDPTPGASLGPSCGPDWAYQAANCRHQRQGEPYFFL